MVLMLLLAGLEELHFHQRVAMATSVVLAMMAVSPAPQVVPGNGNYSSGKGANGLVYLEEFS